MLNLWASQCELSFSLEPYTLNFVSKIDRVDDKHGKLEGSVVDVGAPQKTISVLSQSLSM